MLSGSVPEVNVVSRLRLLSVFAGCGGGMPSFAQKAKLESADIAGDWSYDNESGVTSTDTEYRHVTTQIVMTQLCPSKISWTNISVCPSVLIPTRQWSDKFMCHAHEKAVLERTITCRLQLHQSYNTFLFSMLSAILCGLQNLLSQSFDMMSKVHAFSRLQCPFRMTSCDLPSEKKQGCWWVLWNADQIPCYFLSMCGHESAQWKEAQSCWLVVYLTVGECMFPNSCMLVMKLVRVRLS